MRILHIGYGFQPWRSGGLIEYTEDLMEEQARRGHQVSYFFAGRQYPRWRRPWLHRWHRAGVDMFEVMNCPVLHGSDRGTPFPESTLEEPAVEGMLRKVLHGVRPEVVHFQELAGLPSSLLPTVQRAGVPSMITLQDYLLLCPTLKLLDHNNEICLRREVGGVCPECCRNAPRDVTRLIRSTIYYEVNRVKEMIPEPLRKILKRARPAKGSATPPPAPPGPRPDLPIGDYQKRREVNLERLAGLDLLVAQSRRVEEIYRELGVPANRLRTVHLTVKHLAQIRPRPMDPISGPVQFGTLNGCISVPKGARLMVEALRILKDKGLAGKFHLHVWGGLLDEVRAELLADPGVTYRGWYKVHQLDQMLDAIHVGIIPSIWEEAFGYVGVEMLAKGVPILGNRRGGIPDYTIDGATGWLNLSNDAAGLAERMAEIVANPAAAVALNRNILDRRAELIQTIGAHCEEMEGLYRSLRSKG